MPSSRLILLRGQVCSESPGISEFRSNTRRVTRDYRTTWLIRDFPRSFPILDGRTIRRGRDTLHGAARLSFSSFVPSSVKHRRGASIGRRSIASCNCEITSDVLLRVLPFSRGTMFFRRKFFSPSRQRSAMMNCFPNCFLCRRLF